MLQTGPGSVLSIVWDATGATETTEATPESGALTVRVSSIWHSTVSKEYDIWFSGWKYLLSNGYTDKNSIEMLCEEANITVELHWEWAIRLNDKY